MKLTKLWFVLLLGTVLAGCQSQQEKLSPVPATPIAKVSGLAEVRSEQGVLIFENERHFYDVIDQLQSMPETQRRAWELQQNFTSQKSIYENVGWADEKMEKDLLAENASLSREEFLQKYPKTVHSEAYHAAIRKGILKAVIDDETDSYKLTTLNPVNAVALNEMSMAMIGNVLTQFTDHQIKRLKEANVADAEMLSKLSESSDRLKISDFAKQDRNIINGYSWVEASGVVNMNFSRKASFQVSYATSTFGNFITAPARCDNDQSNICVEQDIVYFISGEAQKRNFWGKWVDETFASSWLMPQLSWHYYYGYAMLATQNGGALCSSLIFNGTKTDIGDLYILNQNNAYWWGGQNTNLVITSVKLDRNLRPNGSFLVPANVIAIPPGYSSLQAYFTTPVNISSMVAGVKCDGYSLGMVTH